MKEDTKGGIGIKVLLAICVFIALCVGGFFLYQQFLTGQVGNETTGMQQPEPEPEPEPTVENPVDFAELRQENPDIYAWLYVPGTNIDYPVLQHPENDAHYLHMNVDNEPSVEGAIYTEHANNKDFSDSVTVIYGHNIRGGLMFATLHDFEDPVFFEEHPEFYIYTPGHILTYKIIAAYGYDDRHILNTQDLSDPAVLAAYHAEILDQNKVQKLVRDDAELEADSKIVQLSTCNYTDGNERYIVTGLLVDDQRTL